MAKADTSAARSPRGTKPVAQAFFTALDQVPEASRPAVAKAAQAMIRDEFKMRREKLKVAAAKEKEKARKTPAPSKAPVKAAAVKAPSAAAKVPSTANGAEPAAAPAKRRTRKPADLPTEA